MAHNYPFIGMDRISDLAVIEKDHVCDPACGQWLDRRTEDSAHTQAEGSARQPSALWAKALGNYQPRPRQLRH
jgi:hypothetical protein